MPFVCVVLDGCGNLQNAMPKGIFIPRSENYFGQVWYLPVKFERNNGEATFPGADDAKMKLADILGKIARFAYENNFRYFGERFDAGFKILSSSDPYDSGPYKVFPKSFGLPIHHQLINASQLAWVFGGNGYWNDLGFEDARVEEIYVGLTNELYDVLVKCIIAATNPYI